MNFIGKLLGKFFRYVMLFAMILLGLNSVEAFSQGQGSFPELLVTLGMLYLVYKFLVPLVERFLVFFRRGKPWPAAAAGPTKTGRCGGALCRQHRKSGEGLDHGSSAPVSSSGPDPQAGGK